VKSSSPAQEDATKNQEENRWGQFKGCWESDSWKGRGAFANATISMKKDVYQGMEGGSLSFHIKRIQTQGGFACTMKGKVDRLSILGEKQRIPRSKIQQNKERTPPTGRFSD